MSTLEIENKLAKTYIGFIEKLSTEVQLDIISKISNSLKKKKSAESKEKPDSYFFGAWDSEQSAEEIIEDIRNSRVSTRKIMDL